MPEDNAVETAQNAAPAAPVETVVDKAGNPPSADTFDLAAALTQTQKERDNYRQGLLKAKGKVSDDGANFSDPDKLREFVAQTTIEVLEGRQEAMLAAREKELTDKIIAENRELRLALQNRSQMGNSGAGASSGENLPAMNTTGFSDEQLAYMKSRNLDPEKVKANIQKYGR